MVIFHFINHIHSLYFSTNAKISSKGSMKFLQLFTHLHTNPFNSHANKQNFITISQITTTNMLITKFHNQAHHHPSMHVWNFYNQHNRIILTTKIIRNLNRRNLKVKPSFISLLLLPFSTLHFLTLHSSSTSFKTLTSLKYLVQLTINLFNYLNSP
jgi:hypothetical protein